MPKLKAVTKVRQINNDGPVHVTSTSFRFINTGQVTVFINDMPIAPHSSIGDDSSHFVAALLVKGEDWEVIRDDTFNIVFSGDTTLNSRNDNFTIDPSKRRSLYLAETIYIKQ